MRKNKIIEISTLPRLTNGNRQKPMDFSDDKSDESDDEEPCLSNCNCQPSGGCCSWHPKTDHGIFEFCRDSSLHGLKYIGQLDRKVCERVFWLLAIIALVGVSAYMIQTGVIESFFANPILISFQSSDTTIDKIPFPAFTLCNANKIKRSPLQEATKNVTIYFNIQEKNLTTTAETYVPVGEYLALQYLHLYCEGSNTFLKNFGYSNNESRIQHGDDFETYNLNGSEYQKEASEIYMQAFHKCSDMMILCMWKQKPVPCDELFYSVHTEFGFCCTFNMMPQFILREMEQNASGVMKEERKMKANVVKEWSSWHIDKNLIDDDGINKKFEDYPRHQARSGVNNGLTILVNPELSEYHCMAQDSEGFRAEVHSPIDSPHVYDFGKAVRPNSETFFTVKAELTLVDDEIKDMDIKQRQCYFMGDYKLTSSKFYTQRNCLDECVANLTHDNCQCVRYFMPRQPYQSICGPFGLDCAMKVKSNMTKVGVKRSCPKCLPACVQIEYSANTYVLPLRKDVDLWKNITTNVDEKWANESLSIIHVDFVSGTVETKVRKSLYGFKEILANAGGLLGLTLGFSMISLAEPIYFITLRLWCKFAASTKTQIRVNHAKTTEENVWVISKTSTKTNSNGESLTWKFRPEKALVYPSDFIKKNSNLKPRRKYPKNKIIGIPISCRSGKFSYGEISVMAISNYKFMSNIYANNL